MRVMATSDEKAAITEAMEILSAVIKDWNNNSRKLGFNAKGE